MKKLGFLIFGILVFSLMSMPITSDAATPPDVEWQKTFGGGSSDRGYSVQQTKDGGYIIAGWTGSFGAGNYDVYLVKTDSNGNKLWQKTFGGSGNDRGYSIQQTNDGGYIIAGSTGSFGDSSGDVYLIKTDLNGNKLWERAFDVDYEDYGRSVQQTTDGGYIILGGTFTSSSLKDVCLIKTDSNGNKLWERIFGGSWWDHGYSVQQTRDGGYIIGCSISEGRTIIKTDLNGNKLWERTFGGGVSSAQSVQQTGDGGYIVTGSVYVPKDDEKDVYLIKTDSRGNKLWERTFGGIYFDVGESVQQTNDGGYIIAGSTDPFGNALQYDVYLIKTDSNGNKLWQKTFGGSFWDTGKSVQQTRDGGYIVAGYTSSFGAGNYDVYLIKLSPENRPPVLDPIGNKSVNESNLLKFTINATDPDGDTLTYSASNLPPGASFNPLTQEFSWIPTYEQAGTYTGIHFEVSDGTLTDSEDITIFVMDVNRAPVLEVIGDKSVDEGSLLSFTINATDPDGDTLTYSASNLPSGATFDTQTNTFTWTPTYKQAGIYSVHFEVSDGVLADSETITITVNNVPAIIEVGGPEPDYSTIQEAIDNARPEDTIHVHPGQYAEDIVLTEGVSLVGVGEGPVIVNGKIDMANDSSIENITFEYEIPDRNAYYLLKVFASNVTVRNCNFKLSYNKQTYMHYNNYLAVLSGNNITLEGNDFYFVSSYAYYMRGIYGTLCSNTTLRGNSIHLVDNTPVSSYYLFGVTFTYPQNIVTENNIVHLEGKNTYYMYGLTFSTPNSTYDNVVVKNNTIYLKNNSSYLNLTGIISSQVAHFNARNNIIELVSTPNRATYSTLRSFYITGSGLSNPDISVTYNIHDGDEIFIYEYPSNLNISQAGNVKTKVWFNDPDKGDFHLLSISPAIDAGDPADEYEHEPEPNGGRINCGAYGNTKEATPTPTPVHVPEDSPTINGALGLGELIFVGPGNYPEDIVLPSGVALIGSGRDQTIVEGKLSVGSNARVEGIRFNYMLREGEADANYYYSMLHINAVNVLIKNCFFNLSYNGVVPISYNNFLAYLKGTNITLEGNDFNFTSSSSYYMRGIYAYTCSALTLKKNRLTLKDNSIERGYYIYGLQSINSKDITLENNIIDLRGNNARVIYGILSTTSKPTFDNAIVKNNTIFLRSNYPKTRYLTGVYTYQLAHLNIRNNIIDLGTPSSSYSRPCYISYYDTSSTDTDTNTGTNTDTDTDTDTNTDIKVTYNIYDGAYTCVYTYPSNLAIIEHDNIKANPQFVDPEQGDFHLLTTSPAIDKGDPKDPYYLEPQPNGGRIDCGAYGNTK